MPTIGFVIGVALITFLSTTVALTLRHLGYHFAALVASTLGLVCLGQRAVVLLLYCRRNGISLKEFFDG